MPLFDEFGPVTANPNMLAQGLLRPRQPYDPEPRGLLTQPLPMEGRLTFLPARITEQGKELALPGILAGAWNAFTAPGRAFRGDPVGPEEAMNFAGGMMMGAMPIPKPTGILGQNVWHGSPHKFDKFDSSKIGTGEGAQAYGHGLYLAENQGVAKQYAGMSKQHSVQPDTAHIAAAKNFIQHGKNPHDGLRAAYPKATSAEIEAAVIEAKGGFSPNLYKVDLPDSMIGKMLDWDKPLSQQPESVIKALGVDRKKMARYEEIQKELGFLDRGNLHDSPEWISLVKEAREIRGENGFTPFMSGEELYQKIGFLAHKSKKDVSQYLLDLGIPGIRYLDGGSRTSGKGTSNYVVFPGMEKELSILERQ